MTKSLTLLLLFVTFQITAQNNSGFKIGIQGPEYSYTSYNGVISTGIYKQAPYNNFYSSIYGTFKEDGVNFIRTYHPDLWISQSNYKNYITLVANHGISLVDDNEGWYKSNPGNSVTGLLSPPQGQNIYDFTNTYPQNVNTAKFNYDELYKNVYNQPIIKNYIFGHILGGESNYYHWVTRNLWPSDIPNEHPNYIANTIQNYTNTEVPPQNISNAFGHFQTSANNLNQNLLQVQAVHGGIINDNTTDAQGIHSVSEYLKISNKGNVFIEGSYFHKLWDQWPNQNIPAVFDYLGKYKSIDYAKKYYSRIIAEIDLEYSVSDNTYDHHLNTNSNIPNGNNSWFQTYTSIIHGVEGVIFWGLGESWNPNSSDDNAKKPIFYNNVSNLDNFNFNNFPISYKNLLSNLTKELRYLKEANFINDKNSVVYSKTINADENCILPSSTTYLPATVSGLAARDLYTFLNGGNPISYVNYHRTEDFGLRYTIRTNGNEVIMIITNPNPYSITNVPLSFNNVANPIINNSNGVDVLFEENKPVTDMFYKTNRNWISRSIFSTNISSNLSQINANMRKYYIPYTSSANKTFSLSFGPFDVHVLKFVNTLPSFTNTWSRLWSNYGSGWINWHNINAIDKRIIGDFTGNENSELLNIQSLDNNAWASLIGYNSTSNQFDNWLWCNNDHEGLGWIKWHNIENFDKYVAGDFTGDSKDELLTIQGTDNGAWSAMIGFNGVSGKWDNWYWCNNDHEGTGMIFTHSIQAFDKYLSGDFTGDNKDELLIIQGVDNNSEATMIGFNANSGEWDQFYWWNVGNEGKGWIKWHSIRAGDKYLVGDFTGDNKDELLTIQGVDNGAWSAMLGFNGISGKWDNWYWCNNDHEGVGNISSWPIKSTDKYLVGDFDANGKDDLLCIQNSATGTLCKLLTYNNGLWQTLWQSSNQKIYDWPITASGGSNTDYFSFNLVNSNSLLQTNALSYRKFGCNKYLSSMYKYTPPSISEKVISVQSSAIINSNYYLPIEVEVYPNPSMGQFDIVLLNMDKNLAYSIEVFDVFGRKIYEDNLTNRINGIHLKNLPDGSYLVKVKTINSQFLKRITIQNN